MVSTAHSARADVKIERSQACIPSVGSGTKCLLNFSHHIRYYLLFSQGRLEDKKCLHNLKEVLQNWRQIILKIAVCIDCLPQLWCILSTRVATALVKDMPNEFDRITLAPEIMRGRPTIRNTRVTVNTILGLLACECSEQRILDEYPYLELQDIRQALAYAAWKIGN